MDAHLTIPPTFSLTTVQSLSNPQVISIPNPSPEKLESPVTLKPIQSVSVTDNSAVESSLDTNVTSGVKSSETKNVVKVESVTFRRSYLCHCTFNFPNSITCHQDTQTFPTKVGITCDFETSTINVTDNSPMKSSTRSFAEEVFILGKHCGVFSSLPVFDINNTSCFAFNEVKLITGRRDVHKVKRDIKQYSMRVNDELVRVEGKWYLTVSVTLLLLLK